jgi:hypothetical protein
VRRTVFSPALVRIVIEPPTTIGSSNWLIW